MARARTSGNQPTRSGVDAARAVEVRDAGAWGVAAIAALWGAPDPAAAALALLAPWADDT